MPGLVALVRENGPFRASLAGRPPSGWVDVTLGAQGPPEGTTVEAALVTGEDPLAVTGAHRRGRPDGRLAEWIRTHSLLAGRRLVFANAHPPAVFREPPTPLRLAAAAAGVRLRTVGDLRRGEAVAGDISGAALRSHGHAGIAPVAADAAATVIVGWLATGQDVLWVVDEEAPPGDLDTILAHVEGTGRPWHALGWPGRRVVRWPDRLPAWSTAGRPVPADVRAWLRWCWAA
jgi:hypothetical protein